MRNPAIATDRERRRVDAWRCYDHLAERYDKGWSARFEAVARRIGKLLAPLVDESVLDIGTGTGIVPGILAELAPARGLRVGCDRSAGMLLRARERVAGLGVLVADATALPFAGDSFHLATASFVLSHIQDYSRALAEAFRVLRRTGKLAASSWAPPSDPYDTAWDECLAGAVDKQEATRAVAEFVPWEDHFSRAEALEAALKGAGFATLVSEAVDVESNVTVDQFVEDRELSSRSRWARHVLGAEGWARVRAAAREQLGACFGWSIRYHRRAFIVIARKP